VVRLVFPNKAPTGPAPTDGAELARFTEEKAKRLPPPPRPDLEARITGLIQRLANLIDENRNELEEAHKRIDNLSGTVRRLLGHLGSRGVID
jgi:hypothetical protein